MRHLGLLALVVSLTAIVVGGAPADVSIPDFPDWEAEAVKSFDSDLDAAYRWIESNYAVFKKDAELQRRIDEEGSFLVRKTAKVRHWHRLRGVEQYRKDAKAQAKKVIDDRRADWQRPFYEPDELDRADEINTQLAAQESTHIALAGRRRRGGARVNMDLEEEVLGKDHEDALADYEKLTQAADEYEDTSRKNVHIRYAGRQTAIAKARARRQTQAQRKPGPGDHPPYYNPLQLSLLSWAKRAALSAKPLAKWAATIDGFALEKNLLKSGPVLKAPAPLHLQRLFSFHHVDDFSVYHPYPDHHADGEVEAEAESQSSSSGREVDVEKEAEAERAPDRPSNPRLTKAPSRASVQDPNLVTWDGADDACNPKNWTAHKKWAATLVVSSFTFISPVSSSMVAPALSAIAAEFGIQNQVEMQLTLSIFVLAYAIGPLVLGPLSEVYGRARVLQAANLFYLVWNLACGFSRSKGQMIAFRFLSGLGGSAPLAIGGGVLSDCWGTEERGRSISIYSLAPLLGPAVGPIAGAFITERTSWRWAFYATTIADAVIQIIGLLYLPETYAPILLQRKRDALRRSTGNAALHTDYDGPDKTVSKVLGTSLLRPFRLLGTQPMIQVLAVYMALLYGLMYLVLSTFPRLWEQRYHERVGVAGLNYLSLGVGFFLGTQICAPLNDRLYRRLQARHDGRGQPEFRVPLMVPGAVLVPVGLLWYGWTAQAAAWRPTHWILPNIGAALFAAGTIIGFQCMQSYLVDSYARYAASAVAATTVLRSLAGFGFPLFAPYLYARLDYGWGNSLLALVAVVLGVPGPALLWRWGATLRQRSPFAAGGG
ncbi:MAG: hypothetical protein M1826_007379 [Phylliscum demangeonii]|nr:MAG: hypothetical protein M1826_007379 [Phylliscum demangeonii]